MPNDQIRESPLREANLRLVIQAINVRGMQQALIIPEEMIKVLKITTEELEFLLLLENMKNTLLLSSNRLLRIFLFR